MATVGTVIAGKYELTRPLGSGSMGDVWVAHHLSLGEDVALKVLGEMPPEAAEPAATAAARFRFEAQVAARLSRRTRHIVRVTDHGDDGGTAYLVMELLEGETLQTRLLRGPVPPAEIAKIVAQVARALTEAHGADVIHRDLKPANIFLTHDEDGGLLVKLLDFGIARTMRTHRVPATYETGRGLVFGTPAYMSPEQAHAVARLDHRCDLWALATVAYEALTTALPVAAAHTHELFRNLCAGQLVPVHDRDPGLPRALRGFFDRAFALHPEDRFATAAEVSAAFDRAIEGAGTADTIAGARAIESGTLAMVSTHEALVAPGRDDRTVLLGERTGMRARRVRWAVAAMACAVLGLGGAGAAWYAVMSSGRAMAADASRVTAPEEPLPAAVAQASVVALAPPAESAPATQAAPSAPLPAIATSATAPAAASAAAHATNPEPPSARVRVTRVVAPTPPPSSKPAPKAIDKSDVF
jgi:serine/threonine-protein kinase